MQTTEHNNQPVSDRQASERPAYEAPVVTTYTDEQLLEALGPAEAARYTRPG